MDIVFLYRSSGGFDVTIFGKSDKMRHIDFFRTNKRAGLG